jgi:ribosomal-protein-alanine N-acetyltransferase
MKIEIRKMSEADIDQVHEIESRVFSDPWSKKAFQSDLASSIALPHVALFENKVAGYICLYRVGDEIQIGNIAVSPDFHRRGIGTKLMEFILVLAAEQKRSLLVLEVRQSNEVACKLYEKFGFKVAGRRRLYYRQPMEDALIMIRGVD